MHLRNQLDQNGFAPLPLIASFRRVQALTNDLGFIAYVLRSSSFLEVVFPVISCCHTQFIVNRLAPVVFGVATIGRNGL